MKDLTPREVPGPKVKLPDPPHTLVIGGGGGDEREWYIDHPDCPAFCSWYSRPPGDAGGFTMVETSCLVSYEIVQSGLDGLDMADIDPAAKDWTDLPNGCYPIECRYETFYNSMYGCVETDGGLRLTRPHEGDQT